MTDEITSLRASAHPLRLRMLSLLTSDAMSAAEVARELDIAHASASYHLRVLHDADLITVDAEERIRGGVAKRYRYHHGRDEPATSAEDLEGQVQAMAQELLRRFRQRTKGKGSFTDAELWVTPAVWDEVLERVVETSHHLHAAAQRPRTEGTIPVNLTIAAFRMAAR
ncbi:DNA-binding transcriptional ArsR family regulator [Nocardioides thalensis]|uniref:DNA-binding transcriptional ArsR family regulator n=1 Tax=Nocardioides thalensis TaxID=1914755 RepID=A0A853BYW5_9ACTN|nr:helix-turn-helix domain-containing protein [Nocardioides thalensis]NYJ00369.1 DNA-binding transcriptional ArsR family regulator [Nocardioides thalensis]